MINLSNYCLVKSCLYRKGNNIESEVFYKFKSMSFFVRREIEI